MATHDTIHVDMQQEVVPTTNTTRLLAHSSDDSNKGHTQTVTPNVESQTTPPATAKKPHPTASTANKQAPQSLNIQEIPESMDISTLLLLLLSVISGAFLAIAILPTWLPLLNVSLLGDHAKAYWYLTRSSGFVAYGLLWFSMALGLLITNKMARLWPGGPVAYDLHQHTSLLGLAIALFHAIILLGDRYIGYTFFEIAVPFASDGHNPFWVGLGQVSFYLLAIVGLSFYARKMIGQNVWRVVHFASFAVFLLALVHSIASGSDSGTLWAQSIYWFSGGTILFLSVYRVLLAAIPSKPTSVDVKA